MAMVKKTNLKKTGGRKSTTLIQSPTVKRIHSRPVTLQGWLQKRGSDGLMLWKKRWFVLSDYCLFYYKDQEEDILLGSFVLASWIISPCTHKDKVYKKYSFKAEHNNMRTYYFAADDDIIMAQWLKALTMASLLQESPRPSTKINNSQINQHKEQNLHKQQQSQQNFRGYNYGYHSGRTMNADNQPLYVNAPPKPKRLNDGSTPDPNEEESKMLMYQEGSSTSYYKSVNPNVAPAGYFNPGLNRSLNTNNVLPRNHVIASNRQPAITTASHYECLRTSYTMNQIAKGSQPPRPRSVDFLEYENKNSHNTPATGNTKLITLPRRPKSSMSISTPKDEPMDSTHWSEESYAKKMRESSMYVRPENENSTGSIRNSSNQQERDVISPSHENSDIRSTSAQIRRREVVSRDCEADPNFFKRSASARLPDPPKDINDSYGSNHEVLSSTLGPSDPKKAQQREVSMKRLLEWKERMLQLPFSQAPSQNANNINEILNQPVAAVRPQNMKPPTSTFHLDPSSQFETHKRNQDLLGIGQHPLRKEFPMESGPPLQSYNPYTQEEAISTKITRVQETEPVMNDINGNQRLTGQRRCESEHGKPLFAETPLEYTHYEPRVDQHVDGSMSYYADVSEQCCPGISKQSMVPNGFPTPRDSPQSHVSRTPSSTKTIKELSLNETDEEWGLKLDESTVIKEFSYHYIKNDGEKGDSLRPKSATLPSNTHMNARQQYHVHGTTSYSPTVDSHHPPHISTENTPFMKEDGHPSPSRNKTLPVSILKNVKSKKKLDLEFSSNSTNRREQWNQIYPPEVHDKRQVFSDTEALLYETSSEADDREKPLTGSKFLNMSSDDDRDEEVAAVLAKEHKHSRPAMPEPMAKTALAARPSSSTIITNREVVPPRHNSLSCENITELPEENYMPMTPRKKSVPASPFKDSYEPQVASPTSNPEIESLQGIDECPYVEMTQNNNSSKIGSLSGPLKAMNSYLNPDTNYSSSKSKLVESKRDLYDSAYNDISVQEPLYMEVSSVQNQNLENANQLLSSGKKNNTNGDELDMRENTTVGSALPDILNTTAPSLLHHGSRRSDSSDADDEASKDLDSIDAPRHPRFSLSDTFRPASYYLGSSLSERAMIALNSDHPDSSDSDLVSPPPIPACSPPLDDLDTSIDSTINNKDLSLNNSKEDFHQGAGAEDKFRYGSVSNSSLKLSNSHNETASSEEESVKSERTRHFMKRRPLSADILNSLSDFNILDEPSPRDSVNCESFDKPALKSLFPSETPFSNPTSSPTPEGPSSTYNPYRKNGYNKNKLFYDWNQPSTNEKFDHETANEDKMVANVPTASIIKYDGESNNKVYNLSSSDGNMVGYDHSRMTPNICQDSVSPYANANAIAMAQHDSQNTAPYYYSDLFKVESRNSLNRINKPEDQRLFDKNIPVRSYSDDLRCKEDTLNPNNLLAYSAEKGKFPSQIPSDYRQHNADNQYTYAPPDETRLENHRRSRSLEGLLDSKGRGTTELPPAHLPPRGCLTIKKHPPPIPVTYNSHLPPHDNRILPKRPNWDNNSKKVNTRHSRSLEDLDVKAENAPGGTTGNNEVVYVNSDFSRNGHELSEQRVSAEKEREKIRQWDLMSSAPSTLGGCPDVLYKENQTNPAKPNQPPQNIRQESNQPTPAIQETQQKNWDLKFSAGDLLGRTHEELVLLLIQLRRQRAAVCKSMERCHREIEAHACLTDFDSINRLDHVQRLDELRSRLIELEKQYEKGKPLVNLVDNMVKLGSLYQSGPQSVPSEKLEFNHKVQEQRILADERRDWERIRADHQDLQSKVEQLYRLDKLLQEESGTLHNLQEDKGVLERALGGLKFKLQGIHGNTAETEWYRRQQRLLERELSRVRSILALNSKKLEETVAENARLEQELVVLRQKLQLSRRTTEPGGAATAALESELCRVQMLVGNLLRQRQELSSQVRQLTEKSNSLSQQIWPSLPDNLGHSLSKKKHSTSGWIETDLDMGGLSSPANDDPYSASRDHNLSPLYVNTSSSDKHVYYEHATYPDDVLDELSPLNARSPDPYRSDLEDDASKRACGSNWKEKPQEIKTVRIVKRESERRQRDRDHRSGNIGIPITGTSKRLIPEELALDPISEKQYQDPIAEDSPVLAEPSEPPPTPGPRSDSVHAVWNLVRKNKMKGNILTGGPVENLDPPDFSVESPQLSPVYLSEAARKIVEEVAWQGRGEKRIIPRERRRHHTVSGLSISAPKHVYAQKGSRDDLDMERVLRPRLTTPDVVKSTLNRTDTSFTKETIDNILGAPGKIVIPERYIPESQPQLSQEEIIKRSKKADAIRRMLCETASAVTPKEGEIKEKTYNVKHQVEEERRNREHLLQLSQILAQEVMEKSKIVASVNSPLPQE